MKTNKQTISENINRLNYWIKNIFFVFSISNVILLTLSQISNHGSISYSSILLTCSLITKKEKLITKFLFISLIIHWYKSAVDNTLVVNTFLSALFSIEFVVYSTIYSVKNRFIKELNIYNYNTNISIDKRKSNKVFSNIENYIVFLDFAIPNVNILTICVLICIIWHKIVRRKIFVTMSKFIVGLLSLIDSILLIWATFNKVLHNFRFENDEFESTNHKFYACSLGVIYLVIVIIDVSVKKIN